MSDNVWDCVNKEYFTQRPTTDELNMGAQSDREHSEPQGMEELGLGNVGTGGTGMVLNLSSLSQDRPQDSQGA